MSHPRWKLIRDWKLLESPTGSPEADAARLEGIIAFELGRAVHERRTALGVSQAELARSADMTQPQISKLELGDTVPTLPLLSRLAKALDASLHITLNGDGATITCTPHAA
ncbi:helix-turn-helix domain-containing protein [Embleya sp. NBC_00896]|uniref:helix-turn-helix domain-containing protein n=1 Tax=Embleya sp. NBC_00896 TaxID=2975961 RepID=UPI003864816E|nr:helix-turn-helix transcriptional regulator [Embleya sp. NBC_00896]